MSTQVFMHTPKKPGDNWRSDRSRIRRTLLSILAEGGNSWQSVMQAHDALWRIEKMAEDLIAESEHHANAGQSESSGTQLPPDSDLSIEVAGRQKLTCSEGHVWEAYLGSDCPGCSVPAVTPEDE